MIFNVGSGAFGASLTCLMQYNKNDVVTYSRRLSECESINNHKYSSSLGKLNVPIKCVNNLDLLPESEIVFISLPAKDVFGFISQDGVDLNGKIVVIASKGFDPVSKSSLRSVVQSRFPLAKVVNLSGPTFAKEIHTGAPTCISIGYEDVEVANKVASLLDNNFFQCVLTDNITGVEIMGLCKNPISIGMGFMEGSTIKQNEKALVFYNLIEDVKKILKYFGSSQDILTEPCGMPDIYLSMTFESRNFLYGYLKSKNRINSAIGTVEGLSSLEVINSFGIDLPSFRQVTQVV